jgi:diguanylate cyclase (GGDEF)-like protein
VLLTTAVTDEGVGIVAENLLRLLSVPIAVAKEEVSLTASLGAAVYPHDGDDISTLLQNADAAMSSAKQSGGNTYCRASAA